jgi:hypothetical protein
VSTGGRIGFEHCLSVLGICFASDLGFMGAAKMMACRRAPLFVEIRTMAESAPSLPEGFTKAAKVLRKGRRHWPDIGWLMRPRNVLNERVSTA